MTDNRNPNQDQAAEEYQRLLQALFACPIDLSPWLSSELITTPGKALLAIWTGQATYGRALAQLLGIGFSATSDVIEYLVKAGYVERQYGAGADRRVIFVRTTQKGHETCLALVAPYQSVVLDVIQRLEAPEAQSAMALWRRMTEIASEIAEQSRAKPDGASQEADQTGT